MAFQPRARCLRSIGVRQTNGTPRKGVPYRSAATTTPLAALSTARSTNPTEFFRTVAELGIQAAEALDHAHQMGILHRDIKPGNLMLDVRGNLWITDFGLARIGTDANLTMTGDVLGTLRYMSPEQALAKRAVVDHRTDIYSLGVTLYELLTLRPVFDGRDRQEILHQIASDEPLSPRRIQPMIPQELETILLKAIAKEAASRYGTAQELADDLDRFLKHEPVRARPPTLFEHVAKWSRRHAGLVRAMCVFVLLATVGTAIGTILVGRERDRANYQRELTAERDRVIEDYRRAGELKQAFQSCMAGDLRTARTLLKNLDPTARQPDRRSFLWHYIDRVCRTEPIGTTLAGHVGPVYRATFLPDGKRLATGGRDKHVVIWDVATRQKLTVLRSNLTLDIDTISFSPDCSTMVVAGCDGNIEFWDMAAERSIGLRKSHLKNAGAIYSPDGRLIASCGEESTVNDEVIRLWDPATMDMIAELTGHDGPVHSMAFAPDSRTLASGGRNSVTIWDLDTRTARRTMPVAHVAYSLAFSSDGATLAGVTENIKLWNAATGELRNVIQQIANNSRMRCLRFLPDDSLLAVTHEDGLVRLWDVATGRQRNLIRAHEGRAWSLAFSPDGELLATASDDSTVRLWPVKARQEYAELPTHEEPFHQVAFSPDGSLIALSDGHDEVPILNTSTLQPLTAGQSAYRGERFGPHAIYALAFSADGTTLLAVTGWNRNDGGWYWSQPSENLLTGQRQGSLEDWGRPIAQFSHDGRHVLIGDEKTGFTRIHRVANGEQVLSVEGVGGGVFSPDGSRVAIPHTKAIWNLATGEVQRIVSGSSTLAFSPDGKTIAEGSGLGTLEFFDIATGQSLAKLLSHTRGITAIAFSPDGQTVATGSEDHSVRIWDVRTRQELAVLESHTGPILCLAFSPDSKTLVTSARRHDGQSEVRIWPPPSNLLPQR